MTGVTFRGMNPGDDLLWFRFMEWSLLNIRALHISRDGVVVIYIHQGLIVVVAVELMKSSIYKFDRPTFS